MVKNKTRRNKSRHSTKRKTRHSTKRKISKGADTWREGVMRVYKEMKAKNADTKFGDALKEASRRKKAGKL